MPDPQTIPAHPPRSRLRAMLRTVLIVLWTCLMFTPVFLFWLIKCDRLRAASVRRFFSGLCAIIGMRVRAGGTLDPARPLMLVSNHASYLDVFAIGSHASVSFTPKREVRSWPVIGFFCVLADCVFVERRPSHMQDARRKMRKRLNKDKIICLFPEGTTSDNSAVKPFKSGFFSLAENDEGDEPLPVQPLTLAYTEIGAYPMQPEWRDKVAWVGDDTFFDHFWRVLKLPSVTAEIMFHEARTLPVGGSRKALSQECEQAIGQSLAQLHARDA